MTLRALVYGLSQKNLTAEWTTADLVEHTCVNPWQYLPVNLGAFLNAGGPVAALCGTVGATDLVMWLVGATTNVRTELNVWYSNTSLPTKEWDTLAGIPLAVQTVSESVACHISRARWDNAYIQYRIDNGIGTDVVYDMKRCNRLHADMAKKCLELLNDWKDGDLGTAFAPDANYKTCFDCHTSAAGLGPVTGTNPVDAELGWVRNGKEDCTICHDVAASHGRTKGRK